MGWKPLSDLGGPGEKNVMAKGHASDETVGAKNEVNDETLKNKERVGNGVFLNDTSTQKTYADAVRTKLGINVVARKKKDE